MQIKLELVYEVGRNVSLRKSGHEAELIRGVIWHESVHLDVLSIDAQTVCDTLGQESEDLANGSRTACNKAVVQSVVETDLDEGAIRGGFWDATGRLDHARHARGEASRSGCGRAIRGQRAARLLRICGSRRQGSHGGCESKAGRYLQGSGIVGTNWHDCVGSL